MSQIMRLRRKAGTDEKINDRNNGHRHEDAFVTLVRDYGLLNEAELLPRSYGGNSWWGKFHPAAGKELLSSLSTVVTGVVRGKVSPKIAHVRPQAAQDRPRPAQEHVHQGRGAPRARRAQPVRHRLRGRARAAGIAGAGSADKSPTFPGPGEESQSSSSESESS